MRGVLDKVDWKQKTLESDALIQWIIGANHAATEESDAKTESDCVRKWWINSMNYRG